MVGRLGSLGRCHQIVENHNSLIKSKFRPLNNPIYGPLRSIGWQTREPPGAVFRYYGRLCYPLSSPPNCTALVSLFAFHCLACRSIGSVNWIGQLDIALGIVIRQTARLDSGCETLTFRFLPGTGKLLESFRVLTGIAIVYAASSLRLRRFPI